MFWLACMTLILTLGGLTAGGAWFLWTQGHEILSGIVFLLGVGILTQVKMRDS